MVILTQKQFNAELMKMYDHAYQVGLIAGKQEGLMARYTQNELREILGLEPIAENNILKKENSHGKDC
jgi:hypothetical protein